MSPGGRGRGEGRMGAGDRSAGSGQLDAADQRLASKPGGQHGVLWRARALEAAGEGPNGGTAVRGLCVLGEILQSHRTPYSSP